MNLLPAQTDERSLLAFGEEASSLLMRQDFSALAGRFGYVFAHGNETTAAIESDYLRAVALPLRAETDERSSIVVKYFHQNSTGLFAVVECTVPLAAGGAVLLELIVTAKGDQKFLFLEEISGGSA